MLLLVAGCQAPSPTTTTTPPVPGPPEVASLTVECDPEASRWTLVLETTAWTGGVTTDWTVDGVYLERHDLDGIAYREDGSLERLRLRASIVSDFRKQAQGRTAFTCTSDPDILLVVTDLEGTPTDCRAIGPMPERWGTIDGTTPCAVRWP